MKLKTTLIKEFLRPTLRNHRLEKSEFDKFTKNAEKYRKHIYKGASEEALKLHLRDLLKPLYRGKTIEPVGTIDLVIRSGGSGTPISVLFEVKRSLNTSEMIRSNDLNRKAFHELILHFMRERANGNTNILHGIVCTEKELYVFRARDLEDTFWNNKSFRKDFIKWSKGNLTSSKTDFFYKSVAAPFIKSLDEQIEATYIDLAPLLDEDYEALERKQISIMKALGPHSLLNLPLQNDSNFLNKDFYDELLHIIGIEEVKMGGRRVIRMADKAEDGTLIANTIRAVEFEAKSLHAQDTVNRYGTDLAERKFGIALELCLVWVNRILFLKLLEAQVTAINQNSPDFQFLQDEALGRYTGMKELFFRVLAEPKSSRPKDLAETYANVPYLNSSLFEQSSMEEKFCGIDDLKDDLPLTYFKRTVLKDNNGSKRKSQTQALPYLLEFLNAFDFGSPDNGELRPDSRPIINSAVLGLIFEKINGHRDGAIFTPGFITMHMAQNVVETAVVGKFNSLYPEWQAKTITDVKNNITSRSASALAALNKVIDNLTVCDPAVGSGHFLVSCLNELIAVKSRLGILCDPEGQSLTEYVVEVDNDELVVSDANTGEPFRYRRNDGGVSAKLQRTQRTLFEQKRWFIERCLFGVDINSNSVKICRLRLWIELLKSAYYEDNGQGPLKTLPNIDINIREGDAVLQRFPFDANLSDAFNNDKMRVKDYKALADNYRMSRDKEAKAKIEARINGLKQRFQDERRGAKEKELTAEIRKLETAQSQLGFFEFDKSDDDKEKIESSIAKKKSELEFLTRNSVFRNAFEWRFEFPNALDDKGKFIGFDVIIANPPYIRVQDIAGDADQKKQFYSDNFRVADGSYEFANLFFELAVDLLKTDGLGIFIFPHKVFNSTNGRALREYFLNSKGMRKVWHLTANQVFDNVTTYTCIAMFGRTPAERFDLSTVRYGDDVKEALLREKTASPVSFASIEDASKLYGSNQWIFLKDGIETDIFSKIHTDAIRLEDIIEVYVGLQTSRDCIYVGELTEEDAGTYTLSFPGRGGNSPIPPSSFQVEKRLFRPFLRGRDVERFTAPHPGRAVFFPYELMDEEMKLVSLESIKNELPQTYEYLCFYERYFKAREEGKLKKTEKWHGYIYPKNLDNFDKPKLVGMEICTSHPNVALDATGLHHTTVVYGYIVDPLQISHELALAILNSSLMWWYLKKTGDTLSSDSRRMKTAYLNPFPIPTAREKTLVMQIETLVSKALAIDTSLEGAHESKNEFDQKIDALIGQLYGLNETERAFVIADSGYR